MQWYINKIDGLKSKTPIISVCGDDCAVCPRFIAQNEEEFKLFVRAFYDKKKYLRR